MSGVFIYMEGGGDGKESRAALRQGMDGFLRDIKEAARARSHRWKLVCCGRRDEAFRRFRKAVSDGDDAVIVLLVDAEGPVIRSPHDHLKDRDGWDLSAADDDAIHLMVQTMETWIIADPEALRAHYGQGFTAGALPKRENLEETPKADVEHSLNQATAGTVKGRYHKIKHASGLLQRIDAEKVKGRCPHCQRLFDVLERAVETTA